MSQTWESWQRANMAYTIAFNAIAPKKDRFTGSDDPDKCEHAVDIILKTIISTGSTHSLASRFKKYDELKKYFDEQYPLECEEDTTDEEIEEEEPEQESRVVESICDLKGVKGSKLKFG